ncbi:MAG: RHS repeat-associated core domain-containing protein [Aestuariibacter sp.]|nr:RHS repeat-associated core domain-containing protein [Aestuariibacter sp.]
MTGSRTLYYPYGEERWSASGGTLTTDYGFTGQRKERGIGLYDYNARFYDPALGRFVSADTIVPDPGNPQSFNRYSYVRNNPLNYVDPSGHIPVLDDNADNTTMVAEYPVFVDRGIPSDPCDKLLEEITRGRNVLARRAFDIVENPLNLPLHGPRMTVESHQIKFDEWQRRERRLLDEWNARGCGGGGGGGLPEDAWEWATRPMPVPRAKRSKMHPMSPGPGLLPNLDPVPSGQQLPPVQIDWGLAGRGTLITVGVFIIAFDILTIPSGEGLIGVGMIAGAQ